MSDKIEEKRSSLRRIAVLYSLGRAALLLMAVLTLADLIRVYMSLASDVAIGMMIPRMGAMLGFGGSGIAGVLCNVVAYAVFIAVVLFAVCAGRRFGWMVAALALFSADTIVTLWLFFAAHGLGFLPSLVTHIVAEGVLIFAIVAGKKLTNAGGGVGGALRLAVCGSHTE